MVHGGLVCTALVVAYNRSDVFAHIHIRPPFIVDHRLPNCRPPRIQENTGMNGHVQVKSYSREKRLLFYTTFCWCVYLDGR